MIKVGDAVRIKDDVQSFWNGQTGIVVKIHENGCSYPYQVQFPTRDGLDSDWTNYAESDFDAAN